MMEVQKSYYKKIVYAWNVRGGAWKTLSRNAKWTSMLSTVDSMEVDSREVDTMEGDTREVLLYIIFPKTQAIKK